MVSGGIIQKAIFIFLLIFAIAPLWAEDTDQSQQSQLFLAQAKGQVLVVHNGSQHKANPPEPLAKSDEIKTGDDGNAYLEFQKGGVVEVGPNSDATVKNLDTGGKDFKARFFLAWGWFKAKVQKLTTSSSSFEVDAGGVVAGVRGTVFGVNYDKDTKKVEAQTFDGQIFTRLGTNKEEVLNKGYAMAIQKTGLPVKSPLTGEQMKSFQDFVDISGQLEKKKQELMNQMHQKVLEKLPVPDNLKNTIGQQLPF
jgi:hypothetical protein